MARPMRLARSWSLPNVTNMGSLSTVSKANWKPLRVSDVASGNCRSAWRLCAEAG